jgi:hypothetical protein
MTSTPSRVLGPLLAPLSDAEIIQVIRAFGALNSKDKEVVTQSDKSIEEISLIDKLPIFYIEHDARYSLYSVIINKNQVVHSRGLNIVSNIRGNECIVLHDARFYRYKLSPVLHTVLYELYIPYKEGMHQYIHIIDPKFGNHKSRYLYVERSEDEVRHTGFYDKVAFGLIDDDGEWIWKQEPVMPMKYSGSIEMLDKDTCVFYENYTIKNIRHYSFKTGEKFDTPDLKQNINKILSTIDDSTPSYYYSSELEMFYYIEYNGDITFYDRNLKFVKKENINGFVSESTGGFVCRKSK